ncbi:MAG: hypothetical protein LBK42_14090 [Propionibacteriaceae bacterium]|jgi:uncharacterized membrane protein|nr:hypothetical protein [Propionibacteriaceae bacterium]
MTQNPDPGQPGSPFDLPPLPQPDQPAPGYGVPNQGYATPGPAATPGYGVPTQGYTPATGPGYGQQPYQGPAQPYQVVPPYANAYGNPAADAQQNKAFAVLAYFGLLVLIPLLAAKNSPFARFHTNQGLTLCIAGIGLSIIVQILSAAGLGFLSAILGLASIAVLVFMIMGIVNAAQGQMKPLPLIGGFKLLK